jgi:hypothetical protein
MSILVDGVPRYRWTVSTGRAGHVTPNRTFHAQRLKKTPIFKERHNYHARIRSPSTLDTRYTTATRSTDWAGRHRMDATAASRKHCDPVLARMR